MRIAFISFEYPPDTAVGGIATYVGQVSAVLQKRGHDVEVFAASNFRNTSEIENGIYVHRFQTDCRAGFKQVILDKFSQRHELKNFEIIESPEYFADALEIKKIYNAIPLVVKLHTPSFLINRLNNNIPNPQWYKKVRFVLGAWRRFKKPKKFWYYDKLKDPEYELTCRAEMVSSPSVSLGQIIRKEWKIAENKMVVIPYPFIPNCNLLSIPITDTHKVITYFGRLETRKGVEIFAKAIPLILNKFPGYKFKLVGKDTFSLTYRQSMQGFLTEKLKMCLSKVEFVDHVSAEEIPLLLSSTEICVFPSLWENFPNVCLEAMSAGRAIVASKNGGMKDMLQKENAGILINPNSSMEIVNAVSYLINNPEEKLSMAKRARKKVLDEYSSDKIGALIESELLKIIKV